MTTEPLDIQKIIADVDTGVVADPNRIDPKVMQTIMTMAMAGQLTKIRKLTEDNTSVGWTISLNETITTAPPGEGFKLNRPAQSISLTNDGGNVVLVGLNDFWNPHTVNPTEVLNVNFGAHKLVRIFWQSLIGNTNIRAILKG
jgi:hypothetical protein